MTRAPYIRAMRSDEHDAWATLRTRLWPDCGPEDNAEDLAAYRAGGPVKVVLLAFDGEDRPVGFAEISERSVVDGCGNEPAPYLEGWYVEPDWRGQGIGTDLIHAAMDWARSGGHVWLGSDVELDNAVSQKAHETLGFEETGRVVRYRMRVDA